MLKEKVKAAGEVTSIRGEKLPKMRIGDVGPDLARIEVIGQVETPQRKTHAILLCDLKLFGEFCIECEEGRKTRLVRVSHADEVLLCVADGKRKAAARFNDRRDRNPAWKRHGSPGDKTVGNVIRKVRELVLTNHGRTKVPEVAV